MLTPTETGAATSAQSPAPRRLSRWHLPSFPSSPSLASFPIPKPPGFLTPRNLRTAPPQQTHPLLHLMRAGFAAPHDLGHWPDSAWPDRSQPVLPSSLPWLHSDTFSLASCLPGHSSTSFRVSLNVPPSLQAQGAVGESPLTIFLGGLTHMQDFLMRPMLSTHTYTSGLGFPSQPKT